MNDSASTSPLRIAAFHNLPAGGALRCLVEWSKRLAKDNHVDIFHMSEDSELLWEVRDQVHGVFAIPFRKRREFPSPFGKLNGAIRLLDIHTINKLSKKMAAMINEGGYDVAFVNPCRVTQAPSILRYLQVPSVYFCQEPPRVVYEPRVERPERNGARKTLLRSRIPDPLGFIHHSILLHRDRENVAEADVVLCNSYFSREYLLRVYGISASVCHLGVDTSVFKPRISDNRNMVISIGPVSPVKRHDLVVEAVGKVPEKMRPEVAIICNWIYEPERDYIERIARDSNVLVRFEYRPPDNTLVDLYNEAIVTCCAATMEPFGLTSLESMACSTPVVAVCEGGFRETVLHGETGLLTNSDVDEFADAILTLLTDETLRKDFGERGREHVLKNWTWKRSTEQLEQYLGKLAVRKKGSLGSNWLPIYQVETK